ncbi:MAG: ABC transporter ATP-binding protein [Thermodesulfobacteriota bacterium]|nr:ABC transporter ATP-binding protein [Thermodesulfobacteriota bacterium]
MKTKQPTRMAWSYLRHHKLRLIAAVFWRSLYELVPIQVPLLTGLIVDALTGGTISLWGINRYLTSPIAILQFAAAGLLGIALVYGVSSYGWTMATARLSRGFVTDLRRRLIAHAINLSLDRHLRIGAGGLIDRILRDTAATRSFLEKVFVRTLTNFLRAGYPLMMLFALDFRLALIALSVLPIQRLISRQLEQRLHASTRQRRNSDSMLLAVLKENLDGIETIQTLNANDVAVGALNHRADQLEQKQLGVARVTAFMRLTVWLSTGIGLALTWWQGGLQVLAGQMTVGKLVVFTGLVTFAYRPFRQFTNIVNVYHRGLVSLERIYELLSVETSVQERSDAVPLSVKEGRITIDQVSFAYDNQPVLRDINLQINPHQLVAVVGRSGSGKSTLLKLLVRLYDPQKGRVRIDDQPIDAVTVASLRSQIALVGQNPILFSDTILDNVRLAQPGAALGKVKAACRLAGALSFIEKLDDDFETRIGTDGINLSGGQAQRIAIARALLASPGLLLMDEPTSALDAETEAAIVKTLVQLKQHTTIVLTAHRAQVVRSADQIVVMDNGRISAQGNHQYLWENCHVYRGLFADNQILSLAA